MKKKIEKHRPLGARFLVKVDEAPDLKKTTLMLPPNVKDREQAIIENGVIVAMGRSVWQGFQDEEVKIGDRVSFIRHGGSLRKINDTDHRIVNDTDLLTVIEEEIETEENSNETGN